ncbi:hypothetical protein [Phenylobacterium sp.]|uniref:hypothetical protein n=1 Tax=Phenylobacterium sp. TaxID=1871053 RepID=UPI0035B3DD3B
MSFTFQVDQPDRDPVVRIRRLEGEAEALAFARQLQSDWPDHQMIEVRREGELLIRLRRHA